MVRIKYEEIKARHAAAAPSELQVSGEGSSLQWALLGDDPETAAWLDGAHEEMGDLIKEHDRFVANYREALEFIDSFAASHKNVLPRRTAEGLTDLQARLRGLL